MNALLLDQNVPVPPAAVGAAELRDLVEKAIAELKPHLRRDGGDIELVAIEGDMVVVDMKGNCSGCVLASATLAGVRKRLLETVGRKLKVVPVAAIRAMADIRR